MSYLSFWAVAASSALGESLKTAPWDFAPEPDLEPVSRCFSSWDPTHPQSSGGWTNAGFSASCIPQCQPNLDMRQWPTQRPTIKNAWLTLTFNLCRTDNDRHDHVPPGVPKPYLELQPEQPTFLAAEKLFSLDMPSSSLRFNRAWSRVLAASKRSFRASCRKWVSSSSHCRSSGLSISGLSMWWFVVPLCLKS